MASPITHERFTCRLEYHSPGQEDDHVKTARRGYSDAVFWMNDYEGLWEKAYIRSSVQSDCTIMIRPYRATLLALYQVTLLLGILMMPLALLTRRLGIRLPVDRAIRSVKRAYEESQPA